MTEGKAAKGKTEAGFTPGRCECPYELTDLRAMAWCDGYQAALRWMKENMQ